jgi:peptidyl-prolyl cis-trans isomerase C
MSRILCIGFLALLATGCSRCGGKTAPGAAVLAEYDGGEVTAEELQREANRLPPALRKRFESPNGRREVLAAMVDKRLLFEEAKRCGLADDPELQRQVRELEERLAVQALLAAEERTAGAASEGEISTYYASHREELTQPERVRVSRILVAVGRAAGEAERGKARGRARALAERLRRGEPFQKVAAQGEGPERAKGGDIGFLVRGAVHDRRLGEAAFALAAPGAVSPVVECDDGYALLRLEERVAARVPPLEEVRSEVLNRLAPGRKRQAFDALVQRLRREKDVRIKAAGGPN